MSQPNRNDSQQFHRVYIKVLISVLVVLVLVMAAVWLWPYDINQYHGDGKIEDHGFWSYPRYIIHLPQISLSEPGEHKFQFTGTPPDSMNLMLRIIGPGDYETLSKLETIVEARLSTDDGRVICLVVAPLKEWILSWIPATSDGGYWHLKCQDVELSTHEEYFLTIIVRDIDGHSPSLVVEPTLKGGGNELP